MGHVPREISRYCHFFITHGGKITATVASTQKRRSPIEQGGLEIPLVVTAESANCKHVSIFSEFITAKYNIAELTQEAESENEPSNSVVKVTKKRRLPSKSETDSD